MKKVLSLLTAILLCTAMFSSCAEKENSPVEPSGNITDDQNDENKENEENKEQNDPVEIKVDSPELSELRKEILDKDAVLGVAYLGYNAGTFSDVKTYLEEISLYEAYPFVKDMELDSYCVTGGDEHYLVVPADKDASLKVYVGVPNYETYTVDKGELVCETTDGAPIIIRGNESEIVPNIVVVCNDIEYSPYLSGEDGRLVENDVIYDFSPYDDINEYFGISVDGIYDGADPIFCGSWMGEAENGDGELMTMILSLYVDNTVEYIYGYGNSEPIEHFLGDWEFDAERDMILLGMYGGALDSDFNYVDPYVLECGFKWDMDYRDDGTYLILVHEEGDPILFDKGGATFEFVNIPEEEYEDYSYLQATWAIISEKTEIYLDLFEDGSANFTHTDIDGNEISCHGTWFADELTLFLDLYDSEDETKLLYSGEYGIMYDGEMLNLSLFDGDALTSFMEETGFDTFMFYAVG